MTLCQHTYSIKVTFLIVLAYVVDMTAFAMGFPARVIALLFGFTSCRRLGGPSGPDGGAELAGSELQVRPQDRLHRRTPHPDPQMEQSRFGIGTRWAGCSLWRGEGENSGGVKMRPVVQAQNPCPFARFSLLIAPGFNQLTLQLF